MKTVSKEHFRRVYLEHGGGYGEAGNKYALAAWDDQYEKPGWTYALEEPESAEHSRMTTVTDNGAKEYRLFFMTEAAEAAFYDYPDKE